MFYYATLNRIQEDAFSSMPTLNQNTLQILDYFYNHVSDMSFSDIPCSDSGFIYEM